MATRELSRDGGAACCTTSVQEVETNLNHYYDPNIRRNRLRGPYVAGNPGGKEISGRGRHAGRLRLGNGCAAAD